MVDLKRKWQAWRALLPWERRVLLRLMFWLSLSALLLRCIRYHRVLLTLDFFSARAGNFRIPAGMDTLDYAHRCAELCAIAARNLWFQPNCLPRALALGRLLIRDAIPAEVRFGFIPGILPLNAHAWVVSQDQVLGHEDIGAYREFSRHGPKAEAQPDVTWR